MYGITLRFEPIGCLLHHDLIWQNIHMYHQIGTHIFFPARIIWHHSLSHKQKETMYFWLNYDLSCPTHPIIYFVHDDP